MKHFILFFAYISAVSRLPQLSLLGKDFAYSAISFELDKRGLIESIVLTCSNYTSQPLWMRSLSHAKNHMVWYSQSTRPFVYFSDKLQSDIPNLRWIRVDTHWVWTHAFAEYLRSLGHETSIEVVGPIVWYLPEINHQDKNVLNIVIFDSSPFSDEIALRNGQITNYHHPDISFSFIQDIVSMRSILEDTLHLPVNFHLKTKRGYNTLYDKSYFDFLDKLASQGEISLIHHSMNIYSLISKSHIVIAYPFTSPVYIADYLNVPSIYYDPTNSIIRQDFGDIHSLIDYASTSKELYDAIITGLNCNSANKIVRL